MCRPSWFSAQLLQAELGTRLARQRVVVCGIGTPEISFSFDRDTRGVMASYVGQHRRCGKS
jgi:hypothetical protein